MKCGLSKDVKVMDALSVFTQAKSLYDSGNLSGGAVYGCTLQYIC